MNQALKRTLSCILAFLLVFTTMQVGVFAAYSPGVYGPADYSDFYGKNSVKGANADQLATMLLDLVDEYLSLYGEQLGEEVAEGISDSSFTIDPEAFTSVDSIVSLAYSWLSTKPFGGDFDKLRYTSLAGFSRDLGDLKAVYKLLNFLTDGDNETTIAKLLTGDFDFGNFFTMLGMDEEGAEETKQMLAEFDVYKLVTESLEIGEGVTIDQWLNDTLNTLINSSINSLFSSGEEGEEPFVSIDFDVTQDSLYEIIDDVLESFVEAATVALTGKTFGPDDTIGDFLATLADQYIGEALKELGIENSPIHVKEDTLYDAVKELVDAVLTGNEELLNQYLEVVNVFARLVGNKAFVAMALDVNSDTLAPYRISNTSVLGQEIIRLADLENNIIGADVVECGGKYYYIGSDNETVEVEHYDEETGTTYTSYENQIVSYSIIDLDACDPLLSTWLDAGSENDNVEELVAEAERLSQRRSELKARLDACDFESDEYAALEAEIKQIDSQLMELESRVYALVFGGLVKLINPMCDLTMDDFGIIDLHDSYGGFINEINHIFYVAVNDFFASSATAEIGLTDGGNEYLSQNLYRLINWLGTSALNDDFFTFLDLIEYGFGIGTQIKSIITSSDNLADIFCKLANWMLIDFEKINDPHPSTDENGYYDENGDYHEENVETTTSIGYVPAETLPQLVAFFINYLAVNKSTFRGITYIDYSSQLLDGDHYIANDEECKDICFSALVDLAILYITESSNDIIRAHKFPYTFREYQYLCKIKGWTWRDGLDDICDWLLFFVDGVLPVVDELDHVQMELDGNGAWYKVSRVLCSLLPVALIDGCEKTYGKGDIVPFDLGVLIEDRLYDGLVTLDFGKILGVLKVNDDSENVFYHYSLFDAVVKAVQNLVNGILPGVLTDELVDSMLVSITAENLIQLVRNIADSIGNRGERLESFLFKILKVLAIASRSEDDETLPAGDDEDPIDEGIFDSLGSTDETDQMFDLVDNANSIEELIAILLNEVSKEFTLTWTEDEEGNDIPQPFPYSYDELLNPVSADRFYWKNLTLDICVDMLLYLMVESLPEELDFLTQEQIDAYKAQGWGWEDFLDEIVDWACSYAHGFLPVLDDMSIERGVTDGGGAFYKLSAILNSLLPVAIINGCASDDFAFDLGVFIDKVYDIITDLRLDYLSEMLSENESGANPFSGQPLVAAALIVVKNLVNGILPDTITDEMIGSIDQLLQGETLAKAGANVLKAINNRKQYLIPSVLEILAKVGLLDFLCDWLKCEHHDYQLVLKTPATCVSRAYYAYECRVCGFSFGGTVEGEEAAIGYHTDLDWDSVCDICHEDIMIEAEKEYDEENDVWHITYSHCTHTEGTSAGEDVEPTCTRSGYTGNFFCNACGSLVETGEVIDPLGHVLQDGVQTVAPTCTKAGVMIFTCPRCLAKVTKRIASLGHIDETGDGLCDRCGSDMNIIFDITCEERRYTLTVDGTLTIRGEGTLNDPLGTTSGKISMSETTPGVVFVSCDISYLEYENALFENADYVKKLVYSEGITSWGPATSAAGLFPCPFINLESISFPSTLSPDTKIPYDYFPSLKEVYIYDSTAESPACLFDSFSVCYDLTCSKEEFSQLCSLLFEFDAKATEYMLAVVNEEEYQELFEETLASVTAYREMLNNLGIEYDWSNLLIPLDPISIRDPFTVYGYDNAKTVVDETNDTYGSNLQFIPLSLPACEHRWEPVVPPTYHSCTEPGELTYICTYCQESYKVEVPAPGHNWGEWMEMIPASCLDKGLDIRECARCLTTETKDIPALGHDMQSTPAKAPTCTETGNNAYSTCTRCKLTYKRGSNNTFIRTTVEAETLPPLGHDFSENAERVHSLNNGTHNWKCSRCDAYGIVENDTQVLNGTVSCDATYGNWSADTATCTAGGSHSRTCSVCSYVQTESTGQLGHDWIQDTSDTSHRKSAATCEAAAVWYKSCSRCYINGTETFTSGSPLGHDFTGAYHNVSSGTHNRKCNRCDAYGLNGTVNATEACSGGTANCVDKAVCEHCKIAYGSVDGSNHKAPENRAAVVATCTTGGYTAGVYCTACTTWVSGHTPIDALDHDWDVWTKLDDTQHQRFCKRDASHVETTAHRWNNGETVNGTTVYTCLDCGATTSYHEHIWGEWIVTTSPGCLTKGEETRACNFCSQTETRDVDALDHEFTGEYQNVSSGTHNRKCIRCDACGLNGNVNATEACSGGTANCVDKAVCEYCQASYGSVDGSNHKSPENHDTVAATCTTGGYTAGVYCTACTAWVSGHAATNALGHDFSENAERAHALNNGTHNWRCSRCDAYGKVENDTQVLNGTVSCDATYGNWSADTATCTAGGSHSRTCSVCSYVQTESTGQLGHDWIQDTSDTAHRKSAATCEAAAVWYKSCSRCLINSTETFTSGSPLRHDFSGVYQNVSSGTHNRKCTRCDAYGLNGDVNATEACSGGTANCVDKAVCEYCQTAYGSVDGSNHKTPENRAAVAATCTTGGYTAGVYCTACSTWVSGHTATNALDHNWGEWTTTTAPACLTKGEETRECARCHITETRDVDALGHDMVRFAEIPPTCTTPGRAEHFQCFRCSKIFMDAEGKMEATTDDLILLVGPHSYGEWTKLDDTQHQRVCQYNASHVETAAHRWNNGETVNGTTVYTCLDCGATSSEHVHDWGDWEQLDDALHQRVCKTDNSHVETDYHIEVLNEQDPTCTGNGYIFYTCLICGGIIGDMEIIPALGHDMTKTAAKPATCTEAGNNEYYTCSNCHYVFKDVDGNTKTTVEDETLAALNHDPVKVEAKDPVCAVNGNNEYYACSRCDKVFKDAACQIETTLEAETIPALVHNMTKTAAKAATCTEAGNNEYYFCSVCRQFFKDAAGKTKTTIEAETIPASGHTMTRIAKDATCTEPGYNEYYACSKCGRFFKDADGQTETTVEAETIPPKDHDWGDWEQLDDARHQRVCKNDNTHVETDYHIEVLSEQAPTCTGNGYSVYTCLICGGIIGDMEIIPALGHLMVKTAAKAPSCTEPGNNEYYTCSRPNCLKVYKDAAGKTKTTVEKETLAALGHDPVKVEANAPACAENGNNEYYACTRCDKVFKDAAGQIETTVETETIPALGHDMTKTAAQKATCTTAGNKEYYTCLRCHNVFKDAAGQTKTIVPDETMIPALGHALTMTAAKEATCTEEGNIQYYVCSRCHKLFRDADAHEEITLEYTVIPKIPHVEVVTVEEATCTKSGYKLYLCSLCGNPTRDPEWIPAPGHDMKKTEAKAPNCTEAGNNEYYTCSRCGKVFKDAEGKTETTVAAETLAKLGHDTKKTEAKPATCTEAGNNEYYTCSRCGKVFKDADGNVETSVPAETIPPIGHTMKKTNPKKPTCTTAGNNAYYFCKNCSKYFKDAAGKTKTTIEDETIPPLGHDMTKTDAKAPNCTEAGNNEYYTCSRCHKVFKDADGNTETSVAAETLAKLGHDMTKTDAKTPNCTEAGNNEYYTCSRCKKVFKDADGNIETSVAAEMLAKLGHDMTKTEAKAPNCTETGNNEYYTCSRCLKVFKDADGNTETSVAAETLAKLGHDMKKTGAKEVTCTEAGNNEYYTCMRCNKVFKDAAGKIETTVEAETIPAPGHSMKKTNPRNANCTTAGNNAYYFCKNCSKYFKDAAGKIETTLEAETIPPLGHDMTKTAAKEPTCTEAGNNEYYTCSRCHNVFKDADGKTETTVAAETLAKLGHAMTKTAAVTATCTTAGNNEYYTCSRCHKVFKDAGGKTETDVAAETLAALGHDYGDWEYLDENTHQRVCKNDAAHTQTDTHTYSEWVTTKEATLRDFGEQERKCDVCGGTQKQQIPILEGTETEDEETGIKVTYTGESYESKEVRVVVEEEFTGSRFMAQSVGKIETWNIKTYLGDEEIQPDAPVLVSIPLPEGFNPKSIFVYHVNSNTGKLEKLTDIRVENGFITFMANSFSTYIVTDESTEGQPFPDSAFLMGDVDIDGKISAADARLALRRSVSLESYTQESVPYRAADVDHNGKVESSDARSILRGSVGLENPQSWKK